MKIYTEYERMPKNNGLSFKSLEAFYHGRKDVPIRFVVTGSDRKDHHVECDLAAMEKYRGWPVTERKSIFGFRRRDRENTDKFTAALIIPTGIGCELGGHEGDANVVAQLVASVCDRLITHPNVVNATDYNEMPSNTLYVEGSSLTRLLTGQVGLQPVRSNRILALVDKGTREFNDEIINAVSTARITLGIDADVHEMDQLTSCSIALTPSGRATGNLKKMERLFDEIESRGKDYDAIALSTHLERDTEWCREYFDVSKPVKDVVVNPTGGVEAMMTHSVVERFRKPCAHAPAPEKGIKCSGVAEPRLAPFTGSIRHIHCVLKGLHKSPRIVDYDKGLNASDVSCVIIPDGCVGLPVLACIGQGIPLIAVKNRNIMGNNLDDLPFARGKFFRAANYLEAVGLMQMIRNGIALDTVTRPIGHTRLV